jgi:hypothetical protein
MEAVMKKSLAVGFALVLGFSMLSISQASAKAFKNCTELNKVYPGGVALPGAVNKGGVTKLAPKVSKKLYDANKKSDRDKDGIACEK